MGKTLKDVKQITRTSLQLTSIKGIGRVLRVEHVFLKIIWIFFIALFFIVAIYMVTMQTIEYFSRPTVINFFEEMPTDQSLETNQGFPTALLCNLKPVHMKDNQSVFGIQDYFTTLLANITEYRATYQTSVETEAAIEQLYRTAAYFDFIGRETAIKYGQTMENFIVACSMTSDIGDAVYSCDEVADITHILSPTFFNCYSIKVKQQAIIDNHPRKLSVVLHLNAEDDYLNSHFTIESNDFQSSGAMLLLYTTKIDLQNRGLRLSPGELATVSFTMLKRIRLSEPYGTCMKNIKKNLYEVPLGVKSDYNNLLCKSACLQSRISAKCNCLNSDTRAVFSLEELNQPYCAGPRPTFEERLESQLCALVVNLNYSKSCNQVCHKECEERSVEPTVTASQWPTYSQQLSFYNQEIKGQPYADSYSEYGKLLDKVMRDQNISAALNQLQKMTKIKENFLKVDILLSDPSLSIVTSEIKVTQETLISSIASFMNMFSGITLIVFVEVIDYLFHIIVAVCRKKEQRESEPQGKVNGVNSINNASYDFQVRL